MTISAANIKKLLKKKVFTRKAPMNILPTLDIVGNINERKEAELPRDQNLFNITQEQMTQELDPNSHDINNVLIYPDKIKENKDGSKELVLIARVALPIQEFIANRQAIHLWGNPLTFTKTKESSENTFSDFTEYWKFKNTDELALDVIKSAKKTGDGAMVFFFDDDKELSYKVLSYLKGDVLIPHYKPDGVTLKIFVRRFSDLDKDGNTVGAVEIYDEKYRYLFHEEDGKWEQQDGPVTHGFTRVPVAYYREDDAAWGSVQGLIDKLERSLSDFRDSNAYFTYGILFLAGADIKIMPDKTTQGKVITSINSDANANLIEQGDVAPGFKFEYETYWQQIKDMTGTVIIKPEDFKGGDVSGATTKSYYDPAIQQAILSKPTIQLFIKQLIKLVKEAYGAENTKATSMLKLKVRGNVDIYVPRNALEENMMLNNSVMAKTLSIQTGTERNKLAASDEFKRVKDEVEDKAKAEAEIEKAKTIVPKVDN
jgi:hypothetical protein